MNIVFVDQDPDWKNLFPLTYTKPIAKLRLGVLTIQEKWEQHLSSNTHGYISEQYLQEAFQNPTSQDLKVFINSSYLPTLCLVNEIKQLKESELIHDNLSWIAFIGKSIEDIENSSPKPTQSEACKLSRPWGLIETNAEEICNDFELITKNRTSTAISDPHTITYSPENIFIEEGASIKASILNADNGPIYIGKNATVHEGSIIKGPFSLGESSHIAMGSKIREGCSIGIKATAGGELKNSIIGDFSNKGHEGYLGDSILGNWCNFGALTNVSNLKNTYSSIKVWDRNETEFIDSDTNKLGCVIGDYTHTGISTTLNTGTILEPFCQVYGPGLHPKFIPAFSWGEKDNYQPYKLDKALEVANTLHELKKEPFTENEKNILEALHGLLKP